MFKISTEEYYTVEEVSKIFNVSRMTIHRWIVSKKIGFTKISQRKYLITKTNINEYIRGK